MRRLVAISVLLPAILFAVACWYDYGVVVRDARQKVLSTTDALAEHAQKVFETAELVLSLALDRVHGMDWDSIRRSQEVFEFLAGLKNRLPQFDSVFLVDPAGFNSASSRAYPMQPYDVSQRDYFAAAREGNSGLYVSLPFRGRMAGTIGFTVSRARVVNGRFDGLVAVTISPAYFESFYRSVAQNFTTSVALWRNDGRLLARYPAPEQALSGTKDAGAERQLPAMTDSGLFFAPAGAGHGGWLSGFRRLSGLPVVVVFSVEQRAYLSIWYSHAAIFAAFALMIGLVLFFTGRLALQRAAREQASLRLLITETERRQRAEESLAQSQKMEALGRLTGGVAHDFNNLLTAILGSLELSLKRVADPRAVRLLSTATQAAQRGAALTAQMLAFSRKQHLQVRSIQVEDVVRGMEELLRRTIGPLIRVHYALAEEPWSIVADPVQLEVALLNLAVNARDAMQLGGDLTFATHKVSARADIPDMLPAGDYVVVSVTDTGHGMSESVRASAFEPFFTTKGTKGTGLGLSMVYGFATQANGTAMVESTAGAGTTVQLYLPRAPAEATLRKPTETELSTEAGPLRVLLVDDDPGVRELTQEMLKERGHLVVVADSGRAALDILQADAAFDLLLTDYAMPVMNGSQIATEVRLRWPSLPVLFMTGYVDNDALRPWAELGLPILNKPFRSEALAAAIAQATAGTRTASNVVPLRVPS